jgi:predicted flap endonuclease-1-like 5' DNA nuclease
MSGNKIEVTTDSGNRALATVVFLLSLMILLSAVLGGLLPGLFLVTAGVIGVVSAWAVLQTRGSSHSRLRLPIAVVLALVSLTVIAVVILGKNLHIVPMAVGAVMGMISSWWLWASGQSGQTPARCENCTLLEAQIDEAGKLADATKAELAMRSHTVEKKEPEPSEAAAPQNLFDKRPDEVNDLKLINGIGAVFEKMLNDHGIYQFDQIAKFSSQDVAWMATQLGAFPDRIERDDWVKQAKILAN